MLSMIGHPSGGEPLMVDVRQSGSGSGELRVMYERALGTPGTAESIGLLIAAILLAGFAIHALLA
jgi:hypothetical protein